MPGTRSDFCIRSRKWSSASQWGRAYFTSITSTLSCYRGLNLTYTVSGRVQWPWWQSARRRGTKQYPRRLLGGRSSGATSAFISSELQVIWNAAGWERTLMVQSYFRSHFLAHNKGGLNFELIFFFFFCKTFLQFLLLLFKRGPSVTLTFNCDTPTNLTWRLQRFLNPREAKLEIGLYEPSV